MISEKKWQKGLELLRVCNPRYSDLLPVLKRNLRKSINKANKRIKEELVHNGRNDFYKRQFLALGACSQSWKLKNLSN